MQQGQLNQTIQFLSTLLGSQNGQIAVSSTNVMQLTTALNNVTTAVAELARILKNLGLVNDFSNVNCHQVDAQSSNRATYASKAALNTNVNIPNVTVNTSKPVNMQKDANRLPVFNSTNSVNNNINLANHVNANVRDNQDAFLKELARLKNLRNDAFYKMERNNVISNRYEQNLNQTPIRVAKKFAPNILYKDTDEIKKHKINVTKQLVKNAIDEMRIHMNIQKKKLESYEKQIVDFIKTEENENKRNRLLENYKIIVSRYSNNVIKKLANKDTFFNSNRHMISLAYKLNEDAPVNYSTSNNTNINQRSIETFDNESRQDTDIDDIDISELINDIIPRSQPENSKLKRKALDSPTSLSQPVPELLDPEPLSKNLHAPHNKVRIKALTQD